MTAPAISAIPSAKWDIRLKGVQVAIANGASAVTNFGAQLWSTQTTYDDEGRVSESIAADGQITDYEYDDLGRQTAQIGTPIPLADAGLTPQDVGLTDGTGVMVRLRTETVYDSLGQVETQKTNIRELVLPDGTIQIDRSGEEDTSYEYDANGNVIQTTYPDGTTTSATYDALGNKTSDTNQLGQTRAYQYDADGWLISVTLPAVLNPATGLMQQPVYTYAYDDQGDQTLIQDPLGRQTTFTYDDHGNELSRTLPLGFTESFQYDSRGRQILHTSFEGVVTQDIYDPQTGLLKQQKFYSSVVAYNNGQGTPDDVWAYVYDAFGRQVQVTQTPFNGTPSVTQWTYDGEGRVTSITSPQGVVSYQYDNLGRKTATIIGTPANPQRTILYTYDALSRLKTVVDSASTGTTTYRFDLMGNVREEDMPNGVIVVNAFNPVNQLTSITDYSPSGSRLVEFDYTLLPDGTHASETETVWTTGPVLVNTFTWSYDNDSRLIAETMNSSDSAVSYSASYTFDLVGNRLTYMKIQGGSTEIDTSSYDANDRLLQIISSLGSTTIYGYDHTQQTSQVVIQSDGSSVGTTYTYNLQGNMQTATIDNYSAANVLLSHEMLAYGYGADGIRVSALDQIDSTGSGSWDQQTLTQYLNDPQNATGYSQVLRETHFDRTTSQVTKDIDYTFGLAGIAQTVTSYTNGQSTGTQTSVFGYDGHGSVRVLTDMAAAIAQLYLYDAYGNMLAINNGAGQFVSADASAALTTLLYSGQQFDSQTGLQYLRARFYDPASGRFNQLDPYFGNRRDPLSFNKYLYTQSDPVDGTDPSGNMDSIVSCLAGLQGIYTCDTMDASAKMSAYANISAWLFVHLMEATMTWAPYAAVGLFISAGAFEAGCNILDTMTSNLESSSEPIPPGNWPRGRIVEERARANLGGFFPKIDDFQADSGVATSVRSHALATPEALIATIEQDLRSLHDIENESLSGPRSALNGGGIVRIPAGRIQAVNLLVAIPEEQRSWTTLRSFSAAMSRLSEQYRRTIRIVPVPRFSR